MDVYTAFTWMGAYGATTKKPTKLWSSKRFVTKLARNLPSGQEFAQCVKRGSNGSVSGTSELKETQQYTDEYGAAVARIFKDDWDLTPLDVSDSESEEGADKQLEDLWPDADLRSVADYLGIPHDRLIV